jgi:hypothetical protein
MHKKSLCIVCKGLFFLLVPTYRYPKKFMITVMMSTTIKM